MKPEAQHIALLEALGWVHLKNFDREGCIDSRAIPPITLDLMWEAEGTLTDEQHRLFRKLLFTGIYNRGEGQTNDTAERGRVSATKEHRREAFVRALGRWEETEQ